MQLKEVSQNFISVKGKVESISNYDAIENAKLVTIKSSDDSITRFIVNNETFVMDKIKVGTEMVAIYNGNAPAIFIYPPQYNAAVIAAVKDNRTVVVDYFNTELLSSNKALQLVLSDNTKVITTDGKEFKGNIGNHLLAVTYTTSTKSLPAKTTPVQVTVLDKKDTPELKAAYGEVSGKIQSITPAGVKGELQLLEIKLTNKELVHLYVSKQTFIDNKLVVGAEISAFYKADQPSILIYPPRYDAVAITHVKEDRQVIVDQFDSNLKNAAGNLILNIGENTKVLTPEGKPYAGSLKNKTLFVEYKFTTRSIPAQTTPTRVVVLGEKNTPDDQISIIINGQVFYIPSAFVNENDVIMVPIRTIAEALGLNIGWNKETKGITVGKTISIQLGKDAYTFSTKEPIKLGTAPTSVNGNTFVPLDFFNEIAQLRDGLDFIIKR